MNPQIAGVLRILIASALASLVTKGILTADQSASIVEGLVGVLGVAGLVAWSWISNRMRSLVAHVAESDKVEAVVMTTHKEANEIPSDKVIGPSP